MKYGPIKALNSNQSHQYYFSLRKGVIRKIEATSMRRWGNDSEQTILAHECKNSFLASSFVKLSLCELILSVLVMDLSNCQGRRKKRKCDMEKGEEKKIEDLTIYRII